SIPMSMVVCGGTTMKTQMTGETRLAERPGAEPPEMAAMTTTGEKKTAIAGPSRGPAAGVGAGGAGVSGPREGEQRKRTLVVIASTALQKQRLDPVRVHHILARRPGKHREPAVLRGDERHGVPLVVHELRRRQVPGTAQDGRMDHARHEALDRLGDCRLLHRLPAAPPRHPR